MLRGLASPGECRYGAKAALLDWDAHNSEGRFRAGTSTQFWRPCNSTTGFDGGRLGVLSPADVSAEPASEQLTQPIRRTLPGLRPSRWTLFGSLGHLALGPPLRATPVPEGLPQPGQPAEFEPESEAAVYGRSVGREELQSPIDQVLVASTCHSLRISMAPNPIGGGGTRPRLRGSWRGADPSQPLVARSHSRSIPATFTLAAGSSRGR